MAEVIEILGFLKHLGKIPLLDVRSEGEYKQGHIPGAVNIPLLNNEHRTVVGTVFKQAGRELAVLKGFELAGPIFAPLLQQWLSHIKEKQVLIYCWRGGMRSNIAAWMLSLCGVKVYLLKGGYKSYRHWAQQQLATQKKILVLGGPTGSGKTDILKCLQNKGEQVIDLEGLANHRGSAFGSLGMDEQPTYEQFENLLAPQWAAMDNSKPIWIENESRVIGSVKVPDKVFELMRKSQVFAVEVPRKTRMKQILQEYGKFDTDDLVDCTLKLKKRLGDLRMRQAIEYLRDGQMHQWLDILLDYYDKFYSYNNTIRAEGTVKTISFKNEAIEMQADKLIELSKL